jgi:hypothetical protein
MVDRANDYIEKQRENAQAIIAKEKLAAEEASRKQFRDFLESPIVWIAACLLIVPVACWIYLRITTTTNPLELAARDPWVRAQLAKHKNNPPPTDNPEESPAKPPPLPRNTRKAK